MCEPCGFEYDEEAGLPEENIDPGTKWGDVPESFECPVCGAGKDAFAKI